MKSLQRWMVKHRIAAYVVFDLFFIGFFSVMFWQLGAPWWVIVLFDLFLLFVNHSVVAFSDALLLQEPARLNNENCDPYPMLQEAEWLLSCPLSATARQRVLLLYAGALGNVGAYSQVYDILSAGDFEKALLLPTDRAGYVLSLADVCLQLDKQELAEFWYGKAMQQYAELKEDKTKRDLYLSMLMIWARLTLKAGEPQAVIDALPPITPSSRVAAVGKAMVLARAYRAIGDTDKAREQLRFVIQNGNRLHIVTEARDMWGALG